MTARKSSRAKAALQTHAACRAGSANALIESSLLSADPCKTLSRRRSDGHGCEVRILTTDVVAVGLPAIP